MNEKKQIEQIAEVKVVLVGNMKAGKSALTVRFTEGKFLFDYDLTIGLEYGVKTLIEPYEAKIKIFDTSGNKEFIDINKRYIEGKNIIVFVVNAAKDNNNIKDNQGIKKEFLEIYERYKAEINQNHEIWLVVTHLDIVQEKGNREVDQAVLEDICNHINQEYRDQGFEPCKGFRSVSAKTGENVDKFFTDATKNCLEKQKKLIEDQKKIEEGRKNKKLFFEIFPEFHNLLLNSIAMLEAKNDDLASLSNTALGKCEIKDKPVDVSQDRELAKKPSYNGISLKLRLLTRTNIDEKAKLVAKHLKNLKELRDGLEKQVFTDSGKLKIHDELLKTEGNVKEAYKDLSSGEINENFISDISSLVEVMRKFQDESKKFYDEATNLLKKKRENDETNCFSYWLSRFSERIIDSIRLLLSPFKTINPHNNLSTFGTARVLKQEVSNTINLLTVKFDMQKQESNPVQNSKNNEVYMETDKNNNPSCVKQ